MKVSKPSFDRNLTMKPCNIGVEGICCKNCAQGPCRVPLTKKIKDGLEPDNRKGPLRRHSGNHRRP